MKKTILLVIASLILGTCAGTPPRAAPERSVPPDATGTSWSDLLDELIVRYHVDSSRVLVTGLSMGGEAAIKFAVSFPEFVAATAPLAVADPRFEPRLQLEGFEVLTRPYSVAAGIPFYYVSEGQDVIMPLEAVKQIVAAMKKGGIEVTWKLYPDSGHDVWTDTYSDPAFYQWLLSRPKRERRSSTSTTRAV